jgi:pimeloyl-ACP methyl ester carboxylesterase
MRTIRNIIGCLSPVLLVLTFPVVASNVGAMLLMRRRPSDPPDLPENYGIAFEEVAFLSRGDKVRIGGWWIPAEGESARGTVVMCHGQNGSMDRDTRRMLPLHRAGYNVLMFDFRAHGRSAGQQVTFGMYEKEDLLGALDYLADERGIEKVGIFGFSMGAATGLITAALSDRVACLVVDSPFGRLTRSVAGWIRQRGVPMPIAREMARWVLAACTIRTAGRIDQTDPVRWTVHIGPRPILYIFGGRDPYVSKREIRRMVNLTVGPTALWVVDGAGHRGAYNIEPQEYNRRILAWFGKYLDNPAKQPDTVTGAQAQPTTGD